MKVTHVAGGRIVRHVQIGAKRGEAVALEKRDVRMQIIKHRAICDNIHGGRDREDLSEDRKLIKIEHPINEN